MAQAVAAQFGMPQLAGMFYYGKEFGSKKQKLTKQGTIEEDLYDPLSVVIPNVEPEQIAEQAEQEKKEKRQKGVDEIIKQATNEQVSFEELLNILRRR